MKTLLLSLLICLSAASFGQKYTKAKTSSGKVVRLYQDKTWKMLKEDNTTELTEQKIEKYSCGAILVMGKVVKTSIGIEINNTNLIIKGKDTSQAYDLIKKFGNIVYFTDGVKKFQLTEITGKFGSGTKKGFTYSKSFVYNEVGVTNGSTNITYYCSEY